MKGPQCAKYRKDLGRKTKTGKMSAGGCRKDVSMQKSRKDLSRRKYRTDVGRKITTGRTSAGGRLKDVGRRKSRKNVSKRKSWKEFCRKKSRMSDGLRQEVVGRTSVDRNLGRTSVGVNFRRISGKKKIMKDLLRRSPEERW